MRKSMAAVGVALLFASAAQSAPAPVREVMPAGLRDREAGCPGPSTLPNIDVLRRFPRGTVVKLDVLVVTEPADLEDAKEAMEAAAIVYEPHGIRLVSTFETIPLPEMDEYGTTYLEWLKKQFDGSRPPGFDVVYLATNRRVSALGRADCIGGVAGDSTAFAVGTLRWAHIVGVEIEGYDEPQPLPVPDGGGKVAAHEIGHLLGAEHDDSLCGPGMRPSDPARPCEVMLTLSPQNLGLHFGPLTGAVVRRYALAYARG